MSQTTPHVLVIGAGFGGIEVCKALAGLPVSVSLIDKNTGHPKI